MLAICFFLGMYMLGGHDLSDKLAGLGLAIVGALGSFLFHVLTQIAEGLDRRFNDLEAKIKMLADSN